jgi:hypothetical protein
MVSRLESEDPSLAVALRALSADDQSKVALAAAESVGVETGLTSDRDETSLAATVESLDGLAWDLQDQGSSDYPAVFARARAAHALLFAIRGLPDEAVYEAVHATADRTAIAALVRRG